MSEETAYKTGGFAGNDAPLSEDSNPKYIKSTEYFEKYRRFLPVSFTDRSIAPVCRKWHEDESLPDDKRIGFISQKRLVADSAGTKSGTRHGCYLNRKRWQWFVFDLPPEEHPGWLAYHAGIVRSLKRAGKYIASEFANLAPQYLERFDTARVNLDHTNYRIKELSDMLKVQREVIRSWTEIGIKGFGKLPFVNIDDAMKPMMEGKYYSSISGRIDYFYATKDIRRFLKGELADPTKKFKTIDDVTDATNARDIAAKSGYYVYYPEKVYPLTFKSFMEWSHKNIVFYDKHTRKLLPFNPSEKQIEFYRNVFELNETGLLKFMFDYTCRPRGDYKTFDVSAIVLFRFFNLEHEYIYLITNSVQQTTHLVYREAYNLIKRSPTLSKMLNTPALDIQKEGIYLRTGKGVENILCAIEITSAEGGARSNATCIVWSEAWKFKGNDSDVAEIQQSIRGVDNAMFLAESTVAPKGHWFQRAYEISVKDPDPLSYFQYYDGTQRQNPKITTQFLDSAKKAFPLHYKMFFGNKWEDAAAGLFSDVQIMEMGVLGIDGGIWRNAELADTLNRIVFLEQEIKKYDSGVDMSARKSEIVSLQSRLNYLDYPIPASPDIFDRLSGIYDCEFIVGVGLDRAKQLTVGGRPDRTVLVAIARGILNPDKWGTDRIFFLLNLEIFEKSTSINLSSEREILDKLEYIKNLYGTVYADLEDYNVIGIHEKCNEIGIESEIAPNSLKHQMRIFSEYKAASEGGYLKIPLLNIWFDENDEIQYSKPPFGRSDIVREESMVFEYQEGSGQGGRGSRGYFGSAHKRLTGRISAGKAKDDCIYAIAHAINASIRGDIPIVLLKAAFASASFNTDVIGDYQH